MNTLGLILILGGVLLGRQVVTGRVKETPQDLKAITLAVMSGDFPALQNTLAQRGNNAPPDTTGTVAAGGLSGGAALDSMLGGPITADLLGKTVQLGNAAKGYRMGGTGPDYYDCSGLVWQAMRALNYYNGPRFVTSTFVRVMGNKVVPVTDPQVGDIVLWPLHHIGVVSGPDKMYSAMSPEKGIGYAPINASDPYIGGQHSFYRLTAAGGK